MNTLNNIRNLLKDTIIGKRIPPAETNGGIMLPENFNSTSSITVKVEVLVIGSKFRFKDDVKVGDIVYVTKYVGNPVPNVPDSNIRFFDGEDILAIEVSS